MGLPDTVITSTCAHEVRIQFHCQRGATPKAGGLIHAASTSGGDAPGASIPNKNVAARAGSPPSHVHPALQVLRNNLRLPSRSKAVSWVVV